MFKYICKSYSSLNGHLFTIIGIVVSGIPLYFKMDSLISLKIFFPILIAFFFSTSILLRALHLVATQVTLPRIRKGLEPTKPYDNFSFHALLDPYELFTFNTVVSVFMISDGVEELIGKGQVLNVQQNKMLLVGVKLIEGKENVKDKIVQNNQDALKNILIKPMVEA